MDKSATVKDTIRDYGKKSPFASFLPGIAGVKGTPIWCYYVNRGQAVVSFGVQDKDHSIMEFYPAHNAYQMVERTGFRTFLRVDGKYLEAFAKRDTVKDMEIHMNALLLKEQMEDAGILSEVTYATLPGEEIGALIRILKITNIGIEEKDIEILDGMPALIPYGCNLADIKDMTQTRKAWMQVEDADTKAAFYRLRVSTLDSAVVSEIEGGNFGFAIDDTNERLPMVVDPSAVFDYDLSLSDAVNFEKLGLSGVLGLKQNTSNEFPTCFFGAGRRLPAGESITLYELIGQVRNKGVLQTFLKKDITTAYFEAKVKEAERLTDELTDAVRTRTGNTTFDDYTRYNYMDNVLRGGTPISLPGGHTFYVYSRKHGDLERDYNFFSMSPEFYSQGNGNFRDVNQNRRCDTFFSPIVGDINIKRFYSLIQLDGYNPLKIEQIRFTVDKEALGGIELAQPFTPGELMAAINDRGVSAPGKDADELFASVMEKAKETNNGDFGEGYWSDHWTYNLDLIEDFLEVYPDREEELLKSEVLSFEAKEKILKRERRYVETENGLRQYNFLEKREDAVPVGSYELDKNGKPISMTLLTKLFLMTALKFSALDAEGMGVEMEGGKPGWYDALNGLPGMLGSSMNESYELLRMLRFTKDKALKLGACAVLPSEAALFIRKLKTVEENFTDDVSAWHRRNDAKEEYWNKVYDHLGGECETLDNSEIIAVLDLMEKRLEEGISKAMGLGDGIAPSYFTFDVTEYDKTIEGYMPKAFRVLSVPYFLEGPVRFLKLSNTPDEKRKLYRKVKESDLFDERLSMYKVNASLMDSSFEFGRCRAFTPGWLENESIWLHMEYKYLLELLRSGLYEEFFEDFRNAAIPFLDKEIYGRSTLENSSFIASSRNPNESIHGKGFVARLSGSTIEFISMWKLMFFGKEVFALRDGRLVFSPEPAIPGYLLKEEGNDFTAGAMLLGKTFVTYHSGEKKDLIPGSYHISEITALCHDGRKETVNGSELQGEAAQDLRDGRIAALEVSLTVL
ncbi:MAG: hypothetical protein K6E91_06855 [Butyrivibrio sp.]|nr:hypothetical protein [Butyrivibrio sp.]